MGGRRAEPGRRCENPANLPAVLLKMSGTSSWATGDTGADHNVFLVWKFESDETPYVDDTGAGTIGTNTLLEDQLKGGFPSGISATRSATPSGCTTTTMPLTSTT